MKNTGIQWCDDTSNPTSGCDGCELWIAGKGGPCYAGNFHEQRLARSLPQFYDPDFNNVRLIPGRINKTIACMDLTGHTRDNKPWLNNLRRKVFVGDMGDLFSAAVPFEYIKSEIIDNATTKNGKRHDLLLLTKQPNRAGKFYEWLTSNGVKWPDNVWLGTSVTGKLSYGRVKSLQNIPVPIRFLSIEPLVSDPCLTASAVSGISWFIAGGESDQGVYTARPFDLRWARDIVSLGKTTKTAVFIKQLGSYPIDNGKKLVLSDKHGGEWDEWPVDLRVRQMPFNSR